ncbi:MAG: HAD-IG family 5'-nucleotidase [Candidatus Wallbacteria bacterium]|nr:HAD-IG family 5'-nucleotidase [Candidatus Wallbacteria bacterium]
MKPTSPPVRPARAEFLRKFFDFSRLPVDYDWKVEPARRVYVIRNLRMDDISAIGFDMDYTLAIYHKREIEQLAFDLSLKKLVEDWKYPEEVLRVRYDPEAVIRGLVIDRRHGNFLKMDQFHVVSRVQHGKRALGAEQRKELYHNRKIRLGQERYFSVDTLFGLPEGSLYQELVEFADANPQLVSPDYERIYDDVRGALDMVHRDNSLKSQILADPERYIYRDPRLPATLEKFLKGGKKLFVLTNSEWYFTEAVMGFLLDGQIDYMPRWTDYFDAVGVEASKPSFFLTDAPLMPVPEAQIPGVRAFRKGSVAPFEELLGTRSERVLFIGDHIYGDILRSKKHCNWRTVMIIEEMEHEIEADRKARPVLREIERFLRRIERHDFKRNLLQMKLAMLEQTYEDAPGESVGGELEFQRVSLASLEQKVAEMHARLAELEGELERQYNASWGPLFRAASEISRFGHQVQGYACLYTGRVSNFLAYPFNKFFQSPRERMPHDL